MLLDKQTLLSDSQDLAQAAGTYLSTNSIDLGAAGTMPNGFQSRGTAPHDIGRSPYPPHILVQVDETFTSGGAATLQVKLITDDAAALGSPTIIHSTEAIALATLVAGYQFRIALPVGIAERYLGVQYVIATATTTAGKVTAALVVDAQTTKV